MTAYPETLALDCGAVSAQVLALYAAASGDHNPLHLDEAVARDAGFERPVVHGMLTMALLGRVFTQHFGPGCVRQLDTRFTGVALRGEAIQIEARLEEADAEGARYNVRASAGEGREIATGRATVAPQPSP